MTALRTTAEHAGSMRAWKTGSMEEEMKEAGWPDPKRTHTDNDRSRISSMLCVWASSRDWSRMTFLIVSGDHEAEAVMR
jgi:hypothetical protein